MPRRSGNLGMRDLDIVAQDKRTGTMLARAGKRYVVVELLPGASSSFHGWMERGQAKALYRQLTAPAKANPRRRNPREWWKDVGERVKVRSWWDAYPVINGRQPYRISFWPEGRATGKRIWRVRYGTSMESTLDRAEAVVKRVYPKASGFMIEPAQRDNPPGLAAYAQNVIQALVWTYNAAPKIPRATMGMVREAFRRDIDHEAVAGWIAAGKTELPASIRGAFPKSKGELAAWAARNRTNPNERPRILWFKVRGHWVTATARGGEPVREALRRSYLNGSGFARTNLTVTKPDGFTPSEWESAIRNHAMYVPEYTTARTNPPRDPEFAGVFLLGQEPKKSGRVDGDTAVVESPHRLHAVMDRPFEVWVFGMVDPALGETWNYVTGPMARSAAVEMAKKLLRF